MSEEIRAKDIVPHKTSFGPGDGLYGDGNTSFFMEADALLLGTAQNALAGNLAPDFDPMRTSENPYIAYKDSCVYEGVLYLFTSDHYGPWNSAHATVSGQDAMLWITAHNTLSQNEIQQLSVINDALPSVNLNAAVTIQNSYVNNTTHEVTTSGSWSLYKFVGHRFNRIKATLYGISNVPALLIACYSSESVFNSSTFIAGVPVQSGEFSSIEFFAPEGTKCVLVSNRDATGTEGVTVEITIAEMKETFEKTDEIVSKIQTSNSEDIDWSADTRLDEAIRVDNGYYDDNAVYTANPNWKTYVFDATDVRSVKAKVHNNAKTLKAIVFLSSSSTVIDSIPFGEYGEVTIESVVPDGCSQIAICNRYASVEVPSVWLYSVNAYKSFAEKGKVDELGSTMAELESSISNIATFISKGLDSALSTDIKYFNGTSFVTSSSWTSYILDANNVHTVCAKLTSINSTYGAIVFLRNQDLSNPDVISFVQYGEDSKYVSLKSVVPDGCKFIVLCNRSASGGTPEAYLLASSVYNTGYSAFCGVLNFGETDYNVSFGNINDVASHLKMAMVKDGSVLYFLNQTDITKNINGNFDSVLDGTDGDMLIVNDVPIYMIACQGNNYSMRLFSLAPFTYDGMPCRTIECRGDAPSFCFVDNINEDEHLEDHQTMLGSGKSHFVRNSNNVACYVPMHKLVGKYVPSETGGVISYAYDSTKEFMVHGGQYLPSVYLNQSTAENAATNKNNAGAVYTNKDVISLDLVLGLAEAETKTNYINSEDLFGSGFSSTGITAPDESLFTSGTKAINGVRFKDAADDWRYYKLSATPFDNYSGYLFAMLTDWIAPWEIMEQHLALSYAKRNGISPNTWFVYAENEYKYVNVGSLKGIADGVMTAVLFKKFRSKLADDLIFDGQSVGGNDIEFVIVSSVYRGWILDTSPHIWITGYNLVCNDSYDYKAYICLDWRKYLMNRDYEEIDENDTFDFEKVYTSYGAYHHADTTYYFIKSSRFTLCFPSKGGGVNGHTKNQCGAIETDNKKASAGKKIVTGVKLGYGPWTYRLGRNYFYCWHPRTYVVARAGYSSFVCQNVIV